MPSKHLREAPVPPSLPLPRGKQIAIGRGVSLVVPPGFRTSVKNGATAAFDRRGVAIVAGPLESERDDVQELARVYARTTGLTLETMGTAFVGGEQRPMAIFHGRLLGVEVRQFGVALIGPGYRLGVVFQIPVRLASDPSVQRLLLELWPRRIVLP